MRAVARKRSVSYGLVFLAAALRISSVGSAAFRVSSTEFPCRLSRFPRGLAALDFGMKTMPVYGRFAKTRGPVGEIGGGNRRKILYLQQQILDAFIVWVCYNT